MRPDGERTPRGTVLGMPLWAFVVLVTIAVIVLCGSIVLMAISGAVAPQECSGTPLTAPAGCFR